MKTRTLLTLALLCLLLISCKKNSQSPSTPDKIKIDVSGLTEKTSISIRITDDTEGGSTILLLTNQFGNNIYYSSSAFSGDAVKIYVTANIDDDLSGDGDGAIKFSFKGQSIGAHGGIIGKAGFSLNTTLPNP